MIHPYLERQIRKHLGAEASQDERLVPFLKAVSASYQNYERDKALSDHAFVINEEEYRKTNEQLRQMSLELDMKVRERTRELEEIAQFPLENPNPIFRISYEGAVIFLNPAARQLKKIEFEGEYYSVTSFFSDKTRKILSAHSFEIRSGGTLYACHIRKFDDKRYYNVYATDITEMTLLRMKSQENYMRLKNFMDATYDAYFIIYARHPEKCFISSSWSHFFGTPPAPDQVFEHKSQCVVSEDPEAHLKRIHRLKAGDRSQAVYQVRHPEDGTLYWLSERIRKYYDPASDDMVISGSISDVTQEHLYALQLKESEERFKALIDALPVVVWVSDSSLKVTFTNHTAHEYLGFEMERFTDYRKFNRLIHPEDRDRSEEEWKKNTAHHQPVDTEYRLKGKDGKYHHIRELGVPRFLEDGSFSGYIGAMFDVSREKEFQQRLQEEKSKLQLLTDHSPDIILMTDTQGTIEFVSPTILRLLGYTPEEVVGQSIARYLCEECNTQLNRMKWLDNLGKSLTNIEYRMSKKNGDLIWMESFISVIPATRGSGAKYLMHNRDIHAFKLADQLLKQSEFKYRALFENLQLGVMEVNNDDRIMWVNRSFEKLTGFGLKYLKNKKAKEIFLSEESAKALISQALENRKSQITSTYEIQMKQKGGDLLDVVISGTPIVDAEGKVNGSLGIHWDVTDVRRLEKELAQERENRQREIMKATLQAEEQQREVLGNELHDGVGHTLTYTSLFLQMASEKETVGPELFEKACAQVENALKEVRRISRSLVPPALLDLGLKEAIIEIFNQYAPLNRLRFDFKCRTSDLTDIEMLAQKNIYRIIQELVSNTIRHADARQVTLTISRTKQSLILQYQNDGKAIQPRKLKQGVGLHSIANRVYFYNGTLDFQSQGRRGALFIIHLPLNSIRQHE